LAEIKAVVTVIITGIVSGSVQVSSSIVFTGADSTAAVAGSSAVAAVLTSGDVSSIFGSNFGAVAVSSVAQANATNPSESRHKLWPAMLQGLDKYLVPVPDCLRSGCNCLQISCEMYSYQLACMLISPVHWYEIMPTLLHCHQ